jgi:hypothetical protein
VNEDRHIHRAHEHDRGSYGARFSPPL